jgi:hypothetical protein
MVSHDPERRCDLNKFQLGAAVGDYWERIYQQAMPEVAGNTGKAASRLAFVPKVQESDQSWRSILTGEKDFSIEAYPHDKDGKPDRTAGPVLTISEKGKAAESDKKGEERHWSLELSRSFGAIQAGTAETGAGDKPLSFVVSRTWDNHVEKLTVNGPAGQVDYTPVRNEYGKNWGTVKALAVSKVDGNGAVVKDGYIVFDNPNSCLAREEGVITWSPELTK